MQIVRARGRWAYSLVVALCVTFGEVSGAQAFCTGDCNGDGRVDIGELVRGVRIALGSDIADCPQFDTNQDRRITVDELVIAVRNALNGCPPTEPPTITPTATLSPTLSGDTATPTATPTATLTAAPTATPTPTIPGLGRRHFSFNPAESGFQIDGLPIVLQGTGLQGSIDIFAGEPNPATGIAPLTIVDASEYFSIQVSLPIGGSNLAVCVRPHRELFPLEMAGVIDCNGGSDLSITLSQDHNINDVDPTCATGRADTNPNHRGVCNGPLVFGTVGEDSGVGAVRVAPDPVTLANGLLVTLSIETALPCGDETGQGNFVLPLAFTSGTSRATILDRRNIPGQTLTATRMGENFSCMNWTQEDGPGTLAIVVPVLDLDTMVIGFQDLTAQIFASD